MARLTCRVLGFLRGSVAPWLLAGIACISISVLAQSDHTGKVTLTGVSIPGATVTAKQGDKTVSTITDQGGVYKFAAMAKRLATDSGSSIVDRALQLHGGYGYLQDYPVERFWRDLRVHSILEGTNQVMRMIVGRELTRQ